MSHAGRDTHQHRQMNLLGIVEGEGHHVVSLLLIAGLERGNHGKLAVETAVLLVLRGMHRGVVGHKYNHATICPGHS